MYNIFDIMKLTDLVEQNLGYTPERIDDLIQESSAFYGKAKNYFNKSYNLVLTLTIQECIENYESLKKRFEEMQEAKKVIDARFNKYYDIVDSYEVGEYPENVMDLEKNSDALDGLSMNMGHVVDAMQDMLDSAKYLSNITN